MSRRHLLMLVALQVRVTTLVGLALILGSVALGAQRHCERAAT